MGCKANLVNIIVPVLFCSLYSHIWVQCKKDTATPTKSFCMSAEIGENGYRIYAILYIPYIPNAIYIYVIHQYMPYIQKCNFSSINV